MADGDNILPISGAKGGGGDQRKPIEAPDSLYSTAMARIVDLLSEGEIVGLENGLKDVYLDETPVMNADGSLNFSSVHIVERKGTPDQEYIPGFGQVESESGVGVELQYGTPWVKAFTNTQLDAVKVRLGVTALSKTDSGTGDTNGHRVDYAIDLQTDAGAFVEVFKSAFSGKASDLYERTHRIDLPAATTGWTLRVRRLTPQGASAYIADTTMVQAYAEIIDAKLRYPYCAVVGITLDATQFRSIPRRAYKVKGRVIRVPTNYNPTTRVYTGVWDGTFKLAWTTNPAWIYFDLITNTRYGLGRRIPEARIDKWSLYKIGQYCDELVPDGKGGTEPRFECTVYLQRQADAFKVLKDMASVFRGITYWAGGSVVAHADMPEDPVYTYTNSNVKDGKFTYNGTGKKARHTVAMVAWSNPANFGKGEVEPVIDEDGIARYGIQSMNVTAFGATSQSQAQRVGRWMLLTELAETDAISFEVGLDGTLVAPGRIVNIVDADRAGKRVGGRVSSVAVNSVVVDSMPTPNPVAGDTLITIGADGKAQSNVIQTVDAGTRTITCTANFASLPQAQSVWAVKSVALNPQTFRILGIAEGSDKVSYAVSAIQHNSSKFSAVDFGTKLETRPTSILPSSVVRAPTAVTLVAHNRAGDTLAATVVVATWPKAANAVHYYIQWKRDGGEWTAAQKVQGQSASLENTFAGKHWARVWAVGANGISSPHVLSNQLTVADQTLRPGFVSELNLAIADAMTETDNINAFLDGQVVSFWQPTAPVIGTGAGQAKRGDIWFETDAGNTIRRVVNGAWTATPDDTLALSILGATNAQATADGKVAMYSGPTEPPGTAYGTNDLWFNTTLKKLFRWNGADWAENVGDVTLDQLGGSGINLLWQEYALFNAANSGTSFPAFYNASSTPLVISYDSTVSVDASGGGSLKCVVNDPAGSITQSWAYFGPNGTSYNIPVEPGKKYLVSFMVRHNLVAGGVSLGATLKINGVLYAGATQSAGAANAWTKLTFLVDTSANLTETTAELLIYFNRGARTVSYSVWTDRYMVEEQIGRLVVASSWKAGSAANGVLVAKGAAADAKTVADGAAIDAASSLNALADIASDGKLTAGEKVKARAEYDEVTSEQAGIQAQADQYAVSRTAYDAAITALKAHMLSLSLVNGSYVWTNVTGTTTITRTTWDQKWKDVYINRQTLLNSVASKVGGQLQNGIFVPPSFGSDLVVNGSFESNLMGAPVTNPQFSTPGDQIGDGWEVSEHGAGNPGRFRCGFINDDSRTGNNSLFIGTQNAVSMAHGTTAYVIAANKGKIPVKAGDQFFVEGNVSENYSQALPTGAGSRRDIFFGLRCYNAAGGVVTDAGVKFSASNGARTGGPNSVLTTDANGRFSAVAEIPAGVAYARVSAYVYIANSSGATYTFSGVPIWCRFDDIVIKRIEEQGVSPNLIQNSEFTRSNTGWGNVTAAEVIKSQDGNRVQHANAAGNWFPYQDNAIGLTAPGEEYSASVEIAWSNLTNPSQHAFRLTIQAYNGGTLVTEKPCAYFYPQTASGVKRLVVNNYTLPTSGYTVIRFIVSGVPNGNSGGTYHFRKPKLERGQWATAYTPGSDGYWGTELTYPGSDRQIGDLRNINPVGHTNVGSAWITGTLTYTSTSTAATISMSAGTLRLGGVDIAYNAATVGVTGTAGTTKTYFVYFDDANFDGGTRTLGATLSSSGLVADKNRVMVGTINVTFPTSGSGTGGGTRPCVSVDAFVPVGDEARQALEVEAAELIEGCDPTTGEENRAVVLSASTAMAPCVEIVCDNGVRLTCSEYAPIPTLWGLVLAPQLYKCPVRTKVNGVQETAIVVEVNPVGERPVRHITAELEGQHERTGSFWAGDVEGMYLLHHNIKNDPYTP